MPFYPTFTATPAEESRVNVFRGYNHNPIISENEFYDMENLTSSAFPLLSPRGKRGIYLRTHTATGLISKDTLCYTEGHNFVIGDDVIDMGLSESPDTCPKTLVSMGAYVLIFPDKKYINTADYDDRGDIESSFEAEGNVTFSLSRQDGTEYENVTVSETQPDAPASSAYWLDTSVTPHILRFYSSTSEMWTSVTSTYVRISAPNIGEGFSNGDGVYIEGITGNEVSALNGTAVIQSKGIDYIVIVGIISGSVTLPENITVTRKMPDMDFVTESGNRLFGCRYGKNAAGETVNEIYASKLGDFKNWSCYEGIASDSYTASLGSDGRFTGAVTHLGYPIFFKENCLHKIYGSFPANFQIQTTPCRGVAAGSSRSLAIVNEVLIYKSVNGICAYDGSLPTEISESLGGIKYQNACAGVLGNKYYISMSDSEGKYHLFVYDMVRSMWMREDNTHAVQFQTSGNELYYIDAEDGYIKTVCGSGDIIPSPVKWFAESGIITADTEGKKYISKLSVRMSLKLGSAVSFFVKYDSSGEYEYICTMTGTSLSTFTFPIMPRRCDHLQIKITGEGEAMIYSILKTVEIGGE